MSRSDFCRFAGLPNALRSVGISPPEVAKENPRAEDVNLDKFHKQLQLGNLCYTRRGGWGTVTIRRGARLCRCGTQVRVTTTRP